MDTAERQERHPPRRREHPCRSQAVRDADGEVDTGTLVCEARRGDPAAWEALVSRHARLVRAVVRGFRLDDAEMADVVQTTWLRLVEHIDHIDTPDRLPAWLATTARREALRIVARRRLVFAADLEADFALRDLATPAVDEAVVQTEAVEWLRGAIDELPDHWRELLSMLLSPEQPSYKEVSEALDIPIGSIGPTRGRCIEHLRLAAAC